MYNKAGQKSQVLSKKIAELIHGLRLNQAQVDELRTFVKKIGTSPSR
jgi:hypothetical protein